MDEIVRAGMNSAKLSARTRQPGHDVTFRTSEANFVAALRVILLEELWDIVDHPKDLLKMIGGRFGIRPEASITYRPTGRRMYFEVKKQGKDGNADERACKHHTVQFYKTMHDLTGYDYHPYVTIMTEKLATEVRYTLKHPVYFEQGHYFCWVDYDLESLRTFIEELAERFLANPRVHEQEVPS